MEGGFRRFAAALGAVSSVVLTSLTVASAAFGVDYEVRFVADIDPGPASGLSSVSSARAGDRFVFTATTSAGGEEPWVTDGTTAGTRQLADIMPGPGGSGAFAYASYNGKVFFAASDPVNGYEPWITDGTPAGTTLLANINPGSASSSPLPAGVMGGKLYFLANNPATGREFWTVDPSFNVASAPEMVPGAGSLSPDRAFSVGDSIYFSGSDGVSGREPWTYNGASATQLQNIAPGIGSSNPTNELALDGVFFFIANDGGGSQIWRSTGSGATKVTNGPGDVQSAGFPLNGRLMFGAFAPATGFELYSASIAPTPLGPATLVKDIAPGATAGGPSAVVPVGGGLGLFGANDGVTGTEVWRTDGTTAGTTLVSNENPTGSGVASGMTKLTEGVAMYVGNDGATGFEPFITDGTAQGTKPIADIVPGASPSNPTIPGSGFNLDGKQLFGATTPERGRELYIAEPVDKTAPTLTVKADGKAKKGLVRLTATCDETCTLGATGKTKKKIKLASEGAEATAAQPTSLKVSAKGKAKRKLKKLLKGKGKAKIKVTVTATDAAGNAASEALTVKAT